MAKGSPDYTRKVILYAYDGTNFIPVLVDSNGNIVSVFKGDYAGTLQTVKVDTEGRIIALITDELDIYGNKIIVGNAELAVRLGSEKFFDRRGDVFLIDNFENGLGKWGYSLSGTGAKVSLSAITSRSGGYSLKLTGGSTSDCYARAYTYFPYPVLSKWGYEIHFALPFLIDKIEFTLSLYTGAYVYEATIRYDDVNNKLQYRDVNGNFQDIVTSFYLSPFYNLFHIMKIVLDLENKKYHRLILNETTYDLSTYDINPTEDLTSRKIQIITKLYSNSGENDYCHLDNIIITQNEPD